MKKYMLFALTLCSVHASTKTINLTQQKPISNADKFFYDQADERTLTLLANMDSETRLKISQYQNAIDVFEAQKSVLLSIIANKEVPPTWTNLPTDVIGFIVAGGIAAGGLYLGEKYGIQTTYYRGLCAVVLFSLAALIKRSTGWVSPEETVLALQHEIKGFDENISVLRKAIEVLYNEALANEKKEQITAVQANG